MDARCLSHREGGPAHTGSRQRESGGHLAGREQSSRGIEASLALNVNDRWRIDANAALLNAKFDEFGEEDDDGNIVLRNGLRPPSVPEQAANLWVSWAVNDQWLARAGLRYVGKRFTDTANQLELPSYTVLDAGVDWAPTPQLALTASLRNVTDGSVRRGRLYEFGVDSRPAAHRGAAGALSLPLMSAHSA